MKLKMLKTTKGSPNGIDVKTYLEGEEYDIGESLFNSFVVQMKVALPVVVQEIPLSKMMEEGKSVKAFASAPSNKEEEDSKRKGKK